MFKADLDIPKLKKMPYKPTIYYVSDGLISANKAFPHMSSHYYNKTQRTQTNSKSKVPIGIGRESLNISNDEL